jgi:hypothetical protein
MKTKVNKPHKGKTGNTYSITICGNEFLLKVNESGPVPLDIISDVPFKVLDLGYSAFKECVEDDFLCRSVKG